jgi:hypothetical protein
VQATALCFSLARAACTTMRTISPPSSTCGVLLQPKVDLSIFAHCGTTKMGSTKIGGEY